MMDRDDQIKQAFGNLRFADEPAMASTSADDLRRAERHRRRRRVALGGSGFAAIAAISTGAALALPTQPDSTDAAAPGQGGRSDMIVLGSGQEHHDDDVPFPETRQLLLDTAAEHFDPSREHLPNTSTGALSATYAATALSWTNHGETGMGLVSGYVTTPDYASSDPNAVEEFAARLGCDIGSESCTQQTIPGTDRKVWVADANPDRHFLLGVVYERADGSLVGVASYDWVTPSAGVILVGDDSIGPVSSVGVTLEDAFAFVTDTDLRVLPADAT